MKKLLQILIVTILLSTCINISVKAEDNPTTININQSWYNNNCSSGDTCALNGDYKLTGDITITKTFEVGGLSSLDLNGHTIKVSKSFSGTMFKIEVQFILNDSSGTNKGTLDGGCTYEGNKQIEAFENNSILVINGGTIKNFRSTRYAPIFNNSTELHEANLEINGGTIKNCYGLTGGAIYNSGVITINNGTIKDCISNAGGGAIFNANTLTIKGGTIKDCEARFGGAIDNDNTFTIDGGTIDGCIAFFGGAISNYGKTIINNGTIKNCEASSGGAINNNTYNSNYLIINDGLIENCISYLDYGDALHCGNGNITITAGKIKSNKVENSAIYIDDGKLILNGKIDFDNKSKSGEQDDICLNPISKIVIGQNFEIDNNKKITLKIDSSYLNHGVTHENLIICDNYTFKTGEKLKNYFVSNHAIEYLVEDETNHTVSLKSVQIYDNAYFGNNYTFTTDASGTPIQEEYQWYKTSVLDDAQIGQIGKYKSKYLNFEIDQDEDCSGIYNNDNTWTIAADTDFIKCYMFNLKNLKKGDIVSFDYDADPNLSSIGISLKEYEDRNSDITYSCKESGAYRYEIPTNGNYTLFIRAIDSGYNVLNATISNIHVERVGEESKISGETTNKISHPEANSQIYLRVKHINTENNKTMKEDSRILRFGKILFGDKQEILKGNKKNVQMLLDASVPNVIYLEPSQIKIYLNGVTDEVDASNYSIKSISSNGNKLLLTFKSDYISTLDLGKYSFFVKVSDDLGNECTVATLNIVDYKPTPAPEDKSCEKVIGPTWHWNNKKGICEDTGVVKTYTR